MIHGLLGKMVEIMMRAPLIKKKKSSEHWYHHFLFCCCLKIDCFSRRKEVGGFFGKGIPECLKPFGDWQQYLFIIYNFIVKTWSSPHCAGMPLYHDWALFVKNFLSIQASPSQLFKAWSPLRLVSSHSTFSWFCCSGLTNVSCRLVLMEGYFC